MGKLLVLFFFFLLCMLFHVNYCASNFSSFSPRLSPKTCPPDESLALLQFKYSISTGDVINAACGDASYRKTDTWEEGTDCCSWDGVECDVLTGHVIGLDLSCSLLSGSIRSNSSLFHLSHLQSLNRAFNNFDRSPIPSEFGFLVKLTHLNLYTSNFLGEIPQEISYLSKLVSLDLGDNATKTNKMEIQKLPEWVQKLWNGWELQGLILSSLFLQILLVIGGLWRKNTAGILLGSITWLAYLSADSVAILTLGYLARRQGGSESNGACSNPDPKVIPTFWAPILLVHLGGPETISAYSVEDNELWLRHLLSLATQAGSAFYVVFKTWFKDPLIFTAIPIFVAGIIKYGERVWVLRLASSKEFQYFEIEEMNQLNIKFAPLRVDDMTVESLDEILEINNIIPEAKNLHEAHLLFRIFKILFVEDLAVDVSSHLATYKILESKNAREAFRLIEVELGFMYDVLYTKATRFQWPRILLRSIAFLSSASALLVFSLMTMGSSNSYQTAEIIISYSLLIGAVILEIYSVIFLLLSDWTMLWLSKQRKPWANSIYLFICSSRLLGCLDNGKRWKRSMAQLEPAGSARFTGKGYSIVDLCRMAKYYLRKLTGIGKIPSWVAVDDDLKNLIFNQLLDKHSRNFSRNVNLKKILGERGQHVLEKEGCLQELGWTIIESDFHASLLTWHIATDICYHHDKYRGGESYEVHPNCRMSRNLSNYMMHLLGEYPAILPKGTGTRAMYDVTSNDISKCSCFWRSSETCPINRAGYDRIRNQIMRGGPSVGSMILGGFELGTTLQSLVLEKEWENERKWKMISEVWGQMLAYAAINCGWKEHANSLTRGGELITHVRLLMVHLCLSEQCSAGMEFEVVSDPLEMGF